jgi:hypothetical protein
VRSDDIAQSSQVSLRVYLIRGSIGDPNFAMAERCGLTVRTRSYLYKTQGDK